MTAAQVVETSVTVNKSPIQGYTDPAWRLYANYNILKQIFTSGSVNSKQLMTGSEGNS